MSQRTTEASIQPGKPVIGAGAFGENVVDDLAELFGLIGSLPQLNIINGSFEISTDGIAPDSCDISLYPGGSSGLEKNVPMHGKQGYKFVHPGGAGNGGGYLLFDYFPVDELVTSALQGLYYASAAGMKNEVILLWYDKNKVALGGTPSTTLYSSTANPAVATRSSWEFTPPAGARFLRLKLVGGNSDTNVAGTAYFDGFCIISAYISKELLKTASGEVSVAATTAQCTLPGGEYGFFPRLKRSGSNPADPSLEAATMYNGAVTALVGTNYITMITLTTTAGVLYAMQRYVTASGRDMWCFAVVDESGNIITSYIAPDHPCYGNGDNPEAMPHPFFSAKGPVVCLSMDAIRDLTVEAKRNGRSTLSELMEGGWTVDMSGVEPWSPRDIDGTRIMNSQHPSFTHRKLLKAK